MTLDAFELLKNSPESNIADWLKKTQIISYGVVAEVLDHANCKIQKVVQNSIGMEVFTMPVLSLSSALYESGVQPAIGDLVLMLFVDLFNPQMFNDPTIRASAPGSYTIIDPQAHGYNKFSGVALLIAPKANRAEYQEQYSMEAGIPTKTVVSRVKTAEIFRREMTTIFDALPDGGSLIDRLVTVLFGKHSPFTITHNADVDVIVGTEFDAELNISIGEKSGSALTDPNAPVTVTIGENADISITSKSKKTEHYDKDVALDTSGKYSMTAAGTVEVATSTADLVKIGNMIGTLGAQLDSLVTILQGINTLGGPTAQALNPAVILQLTNWKTQWDLIFD